MKPKSFILKPSNAFFGRGTKGPQQMGVMQEKNALKAVWPESDQLLCYMQCWWKWLWDAKNGIDLPDRQFVF